METYGVSFEGFEPSCGWAMYKHTEEELLPQLKAELERWRKRRDEAANERLAIRGLKTDLECLLKSREGLVGKLAAKISGSNTEVNDVMPLGVKEAEIKTCNSWQELSSWLDTAKSPVEQIAVFYKHACERADCCLGMFENCIESTSYDIRFWQRTLELQRAYWVFEKSELKYKTKICRELVKTLADYIGDCREQLGRYDNGDAPKSALQEDIEWLFEEAQADLAYYRQIRADIAAVGVEEAMRRSTRRITQSDDCCCHDKE